MLSEEIREFLSSLELCDICVQRYLNKNNFNVTERKIENDITNKIKRLKPNICIACCSIFQEIDSVVEEVINNSSLRDYEAPSLFSSISIPITLLIRDLSIWVTLLQKFRGEIDDSKITLCPC